MKTNELIEMIKYWEVADNKPQEDRGNYTVYEWRIVDQASGQVYRYVGCTRNGIKARLQSGHGYDGQYAGQIIDLFGFLNLTCVEVVTGISTKEEAEFIEKQVIAIRKPNLNRNNGGTGNVKGAQYDTGHYVQATKNGIKEVIIKGIHLASYGRDFKEKEYKLIDLLEEINNINGIERIRLRFT